MVKLKTVLDLRRAKSDGTYNILFRITNHKEVKYIPLGVSVAIAHWDETTTTLNKHHPNGNSINTLISKRYFEIQRALLTLEDNYSFDALKEIINPQIEEKPKLVTFKDFADDVISDMIKAKRTGGALVYQTAVNRLLSYCHNDALLFSQIDYTLLDGFKTKLIQQDLKPNSIGNYLRTIRALFNKAIKAKLVGREFYPFHDIPIKTESTAKRAINVLTLTKIYNVPKVRQTPEWHAANYFFLSFTLRGMSFTDMAYLKQSNLKDSYLTYRRRKTKKLYNIKLHPLANQILNLYKSSENAYLIPIIRSNVKEDSLEAKKITRQWIKTTNKYLNKIANKCGIDSNITTYVIRHTWANLAKSLGYSNEIIAECLGHEYGNKVTNIYLDSFDQTLVDEVNSRIVALIE